MVQILNIENRVEWSSQTVSDGPDIKGLVEQQRREE